VPATVAAVRDAFRHGPDRDRLAIRVTAAEGLRWRGDPLVLERYPAPSRALEGIVARLDVEPREG
jgi:hypothetical protein